ncbi:MAG: T9SS type A sorting domain-containing protein [Patescibacteria group bacterium]
MKKLVILVVVVLFAEMVMGQFVSLNSGETNNLTTITHNGNSLFIGGYNKILKSSDAGLTWQTVLLLNCGDIKQIVFSGNNGLACTGNELFNSLDGGNSWTLINLPDSVYSINAISFRNQFEAYVLATKPGGSGCGGRVFRSFTQGAQWTKVEFFEYSSSEPTAICWKNDTAFTILRYFNGTDYFNFMAEMGSDFSIQNTQTIFTQLFYGSKICIADNKFLIYGYNSFGKSMLIQKVFSDYTSYESMLISPNSVYFLNMALSNEQAILCGMNGIIEKVSTTGTLSTNNPALIQSGINMPLFDVDVFQSSIYAVGYNGTLITNNSNLFTGVKESSVIDREIICQNPFDQNLNIKSSEKGLIQIYSTDGKIIFEETKNDEEINIQTAHFPKGIYVIRINEEIKKVVK